MPGPVNAGAITKRSDTNAFYVLDMAPFVARYWMPGAFFSEGDVIRPRALQDGGSRGSTGFDYINQSDGQTAEKEPKYPTPAGQVIADGSCSWQAMLPSEDAFDRTIASASNITWSADDASITPTAGAFKNSDGELKAGVFIAGGTDGTVANVNARIVFSDGTTEDFWIRVTVDDSYSA